MRLREQNELLIRAARLTRTDPEALHREMRLTRRRGYSINKEEYRTEVVGVAADAPTPSITATTGFFSDAARTAR